MDGLRAIAVLAVIGFHSNVAASRGGYVGVDIFFVLSGFLITALLLKEKANTGHIAYSQFLARRAARLLPATSLLLAVYVCYDLFVAKSGYGLLEAAFIWFAVSDYSYAILHMPEMLNHTWSLSVEQKFYLFWPIFIAFFAKLTPKTALWTLVCLYLAATIWRLTDLWLWSNWDWTYYRFDTRLSGFLAGAILAFRPLNISPLRLPLVEKACLTVLLLAIFFDTWPFAPGMFAAMPATEWATVVLIACVSSGRGELRTLLMSRPLVYIGTISYGIYLWHYPVIKVLPAGFSRLEIFMISLALSAVIASASWFLIERPTSRWARDRLSKSAVNA